jgi:hypothetical protein
MRLSVIIVAAALLAAAAAAADARTEPEKGCPSSHPVPVPYPPVQGRGVDGHGHDCTGRPHGGPAATGAKESPIKAHAGSTAGEVRGPVSGTVK